MFFRFGNSKFKTYWRKSINMYKDCGLILQCAVKKIWTNINIAFSITTLDLQGKYDKAFKIPNMP